jgi:carboxyl-terminal processing protease
MRVGWVVGTFLALAAAAAAAPRGVAPARNPSVEAVVSPETAAFAQNLFQVVNYVQMYYVRPVEVADLLRAALGGLYEAARIPVPRDLHARLRKAPVERPDGAGMVPRGARAPTIPTPEVMAVIHRAYEETAGSGRLEGQKPLLVACREMARSLDPHTAVITAAEARQASTLSQTYDGVGLELDEAPGRLVVRTVLPGGPAQRAGLLPGDEIVRVNGRAVAELLAEPAWTHELKDRLQLTPTVEAPGVGVGGSVAVEFRRPGQKGRRELILHRERFRPETVLGVARRDDGSWEYWLDRRRGLAHVRVGSLAGGTADELGAVLGRLRDGGLRGLLLDLRWSPGGFLKEASGSAELFLGPALVATIKQREGEEVYRSAGEGKFLDFPVVVLVNGETSGGAELIAAALQDHKRAVVAGQRTRGKASVQTSVFVDEVGLKLTTGTFLRPGGKNLHRFPTSTPADDWGVRPDPGLDVRVSAELGRRLERWWLLQSLRPGNASQTLPLDDPDLDPQRQAAAAVLRREVEQKGKQGR